MGTNVQRTMDGLPPFPKSDTLAAKLARVMGKIERIPKTGWNDNQKYKFAQESDLLAFIRPLLAEEGIVIVPVVTKHKMTAQGTTRSGNTNWLTTVTMRFDITDGETTYGVVSVGYGQDVGDKGVYKAMTGATKYALMKLFLVDTGDDPEADTKVDQRAVESRVTTHKQEGVRKGGRTTLASATQVRRVAEVMVKLGWKREQLVFFLDAKDYLLLGELPVDEKEAGALIAEKLGQMPSEKIGELIRDMEAVLVEGKYEIEDVKDAEDGPYS